jgi:hypothetical protein
MAWAKLRPVAKFCRRQHASERKRPPIACDVERIEHRTKVHESLDTDAARHRGNLRLGARVCVFQPRRAPGFRADLVRSREDARGRRPVCRHRSRPGTRPDLAIAIPGPRARHRHAVLAPECQNGSHRFHRPRGRCPGRRTDSRRVGRPRGSKRPGMLRRTSRWSRCCPSEHFCYCRWRAGAGRKLACSPPWRSRRRTLCRMVRC